MAIKIVKLSTSTGDSIVKENLKIQTNYEYEPKVQFPGEVRVKRKTLTGDVNKVLEYLYDNLDRVTAIYSTQDGVTTSKTYLYDQNDNETMATNDDGIDQLVVHRVQEDKIGTAFREEYIATTGQTLFTLAHEYPVGNKSLFVFKDGQLVSNSYYIETSNTSVTLNTGCTAGNILTFMLPIASTSNESNKRIFNVSNQSEFICIHGLGTKALHVSIWVNNEEIIPLKKQTITINEVKIICATPITGTVVIS